MYSVLLKEAEAMKVKAEVQEGADSTFKESRAGEVLMTATAAFLVKI